MKLVKLILKWIVVPALFALLGYYFVAPRVYDNSAPAVPPKEDTVTKVQKQLEEEKKHEKVVAPDVEVGDVKGKNDSESNR